MSCTSSVRERPRSKIVSYVSVGPGGGGGASTSWAVSTTVGSTRTALSAPCARTASAAALVVSCAPSPGTPSSPATRASRTARLERQIVVLLIKRLRERVERFRLAFGSDLGRGPRARKLGSSFAAATRRQQDHFPCDDLGDVARLLLTVFPGAVLDPAFDIELVALLHVLLGQIGQLGAFVVPADDPVPLGLLLALPPSSGPLPAGRKGQVGHAAAVVSAPHLGIGAQVPD